MKLPKKVDPHSSRWVDSPKKMVYMVYNFIGNLTHLHIQKSPEPQALHTIFGRSLAACPRRASVWEIIPIPNGKNVGGRSGDGVEMLREYLWDFHGIVTGIYRICSRSYWIYSWDPYISLWDTILYIGYLIKPTWDTSECCGDVKGIWNFMEYSTYGIFF